METCPVLEQFLCHVAKTGQPLWVTTHWLSLTQISLLNLFLVQDVFQDLLFFCVADTQTCISYTFQDPVVPVKQYFMFKLEKVMDDFPRFNTRTESLTQSQCGARALWRDEDEDLKNSGWLQWVSEASNKPLFKLLTNHKFMYKITWWGSSSTWMQSLSID